MYHTASAFAVIIFHHDLFDDLFDFGLHALIPDIFSHVPILPFSFSTTNNHVHLESFEDIYVFRRPFPSIQVGRL